MKRGKQGKEDVKEENSKGRSEERTIKEKKLSIKTGSDRGERSEGKKKCSERKIEERRNSKWNVEGK